MGRLTPPETNSKLAPKDLEEAGPEDLQKSLDFWGCKTAGKIREVKFFSFNWKVRLQICNLPILRLPKDTQG